MNYFVQSGEEEERVILLDVASAALASFHNTGVDDIIRAGLPGGDET